MFQSLIFLLTAAEFCKNTLCFWWDIYIQKLLMHVHWLQAIDQSSDWSFVSVLEFIHINLINTIGDTQRHAKINIRKTGIFSPVKTTRIRWSWLIFIIGIDPMFQGVTRHWDRESSKTNLDLLVYKIFI